MSHPLVVHCKKAAHDVYVGRPSKWGNPFSHLPNSAAAWRVNTREEAIERYRAWICDIEQEALRDEARRTLRGKVLGCWCSPLPCHADVLAQIANSHEEDEA